MRVSIAARKIAANDSFFTDSSRFPHSFHAGSTYPNSGDSEALGRVSSSYLARRNFIHNSPLARGNRTSEAENCSGCNSDHLQPCNKENDDETWHLVVARSK